MLYLTRKVGESVIINDDVEITVVEVRGRSIKLGFTFPAHVSVLRREIYERIQAENRAAAVTVDPVADPGLAADLAKPIGERLQGRIRPLPPAASGSAERPASERPPAERPPTERPLPERAPLDRSANARAPAAVREPRPTLRTAPRPPRLPQG